MKSLTKKYPTPEKDDYYFNEIGLMVFTENYHLKRGFCCKSGCKNCPYGFYNNLIKSDKKSITE
jgi:hypothetical protein